MSLKKGYIKDNETGIIKNFMYNPSEYQYRRTAAYTETSAPGSPYPILSFIRGEVTIIPVKLFLVDKAKVGKIPEFIEFLERFLPEENSSALFVRPRTLTISLGHLVKKCVLTSLDVMVSEYSNLGVPTIADVTIELKVVA